MWQATQHYVHQVSQGAQIPCLFLDFWRLDTDSHQWLRFVRPIFALRPYLRFFRFSKDWVTEDAIATSSVQWERRFGMCSHICIVWRVSCDCARLLWCILSVSTCKVEHPRSSSRIKRFDFVYFLVFFSSFLRCDGLWERISGITICSWIVLVLHTLLIYTCGSLMCTLDSRRKHSWLECLRWVVCVAE